MSAEAVIETSEVIKIADILVEIDEIMATTNTYWNNHNTGDLDDKKVNELTGRLYKRLKEEHTKFNNAYPILLFTLSRGIYHKESILQYFDDVRRNGLGSDEQQAKQLARYTANAAAAIHRNKGGKITKREIKTHKKKIFENIMEMKASFTKAMAELKKQHETDKSNADHNQELLQTASEQESKKVASDVFSVFAAGNVHETTEVFRQSVEARKQAMLTIQSTQQN